MKRKARQVLSLAEELCEIDQIYLEAKRFQLGYSGELVVSDLDGDLAYQNGTTQFVDEGRGDQDEVDPDVDKCENIDEIDLTNHEIAEKEKQMAIGESCNIPQEQDTGLLDMNSNVFDPKYWPADAHSRCHLYLKRTHPDSSNILRDDCLVVYLSVTSHRTEGNPSLSMALWLSESLQIDLDVIVRRYLSSYSHSPSHSLKNLFIRLLWLMMILSSIVHIGRQ